MMHSGFTSHLRCIGWQADKQYQTARASLKAEFELSSEEALRRKETHNRPHY